MAEESDKLRLTVKTTKEKIEVEVATDATAKQVFFVRVCGRGIVQEGAASVTFLSSLSPLHLS